MFVTKVQPCLTIPLAEGTVATVQGSAGATKIAELCNLDGANTITYKWQFSDDGAIWTDIGVAAPIAPGNSVTTLLTAHVFHRLRASGNLTATAALKVQSVMDWNAVMSFVNL